MTHTSLNFNLKSSKTTINVPNGFQYYEKAPSSSNNPYAKYYYQTVTSGTPDDFAIKKEHTNISRTT